MVSETRPDQKMTAVEVKTGVTLQFGVPKPLFAVRLGNVNARYDVSRDGRFLIPVAAEAATSAPITIEVNWSAGLKIMIGKNWQPSLKK